MKEFYTDFEELTEKFSIMTVDGGQTDKVALEYCRKHTTPELYAQLEEKFTQRKSPGNSLEEYLHRNIALIPSRDKKPLIAYTKEPEKLITDLQALHDWQGRGISEFGFVPGKNNLFVIDIDRGNTHANKSDGISNFMQLIENAGLGNRNCFIHFPENFPCYTQTPNGGLHLYFKDSYITHETAGRFDSNILKSKNIEMKYNTKVTAAGSVLNGREYVMRGKLNAVQNITLDILDALIKEKPKKTQYRHFEKKAGGKWNDTPEGIISKATELYGNEGNHDFIYRTAVLFHNAGMSKDIAESYILRTPQHLQRKDQADTLTAINSIYG